MLGDTGDDVRGLSGRISTLAPKGRDRPRTLTKAEPCSLSSCVAGQRPIHTDAGPVRCVRRDYNDCAGGGAPGLLLHRGHGYVGQHYVFGLRRDLFGHLQRLSLRFHDHQRTGDLTLRLMSDIKEIQDMVANGIASFATNVCLLVGMLALMLWVNWKFALVSLCLSPFLFLTVFRYKRRIKAASRKARKSTGLLAALAQETLASIRIIQGLAQEDRLDERFQAQSENHHQASLELVRYQARITPLVDTIAALGVTIVIWYSSPGVIAGEPSTGDIVLFFAYVSSLYGPMKGLARFSVDIDKATVAAERIAEVILIRSDVAHRVGARKISHLQGAVEFRGVSFEYEPHRPVLSRLDLTISPGEK